MPLERLDDDDDDDDDDDEPGEGEEQTDIIILTHQTREKNIDAAIARIEDLPAVKGKLTRLRLEELQ